MTTLHRLTYFGMGGEGPTVKEAKLDAGRKIEKALEGSYTPELLSARGYVMMIYRSPEGWHAVYLAEPGTGVRERLGGSSAYPSLLDAKRSVVLQLAQSSWDGKELYPPCLEESGLRLKDKEELRKEFASWRGFQLAYREGKRQYIAGWTSEKRQPPDEEQLGKAEHGFHQWACHHAHEFVGKEVAAS